MLAVNASGTQLERRVFGGISDMLQDIKSPSMKPTTMPSISPTYVPTLAPSVPPSMIPTGAPSVHPTRTPSKIPSSLPTRRPSTSPSRTPSKYPTNYPTKNPSYRPSRTPSFAPSLAPSAQPSTPIPTTATPVPSSKPSITTFENYIFNLNSEFQKLPRLMTREELRSFENATTEFLSNSDCLSQKLEIDPETVTAKVEKQEMKKSNLRVKISIVLYVPNRAHLNKKEVKGVLIQCIEDNFSDWTLQLSIASSFFQDLGPDSDQNGKQSSFTIGTIVLVVLAGVAALVAIAIFSIRHVKGKTLRLLKKGKIEVDDKHDISVIELFSENFEPKIKSFSFVTSSESGGDGSGEENDVDSSEENSENKSLSDSNCLEKSKTSDLDFDLSEFNDNMSYENERMKDESFLKEDVEEEEEDRHESDAENSLQLIRSPLGVNFAKEVMLEEQSIPEGLAFDNDHDGDETKGTQTTSSSSVFGLNISVAALEESRKQTILNLVDIERIERVDSNDEESEVVEHPSLTKHEKTNQYKKSPRKEKETDESSKSSSHLLSLSSSSKGSTDFFDGEMHLNPLSPHQKAKLDEWEGTL